MDVGAKIRNHIIQNPGDYGAYKDLQIWIVESMKTNVENALMVNEWLKNMAAKQVAKKNNTEKFFEMYKSFLLLAAPYRLDDYLLYLEINREPKDRFYQPRRRVLKRLVDAIQDLADDKLDELFISQPPRTGKTTLLMMTEGWLIGRDSERSNLYSAYSDTITEAFYTGVLEILNDPVTYAWHEIFPKCTVAAFNGKKQTIDIDRHKRYASLTCRSLYSTLNGACDCNGFLISDDLIGGIEEALNPDRMKAAWSKVDNNLIPRAKESAKLLWNGTRWSILDPAGLRIDVLTNDERYAGRRWKVINLPALNENDESNFEYDYGVGFSTKFYQQRRASFERTGDSASWLAQYQGEPIERDGALFSAADLRYFNGELPNREPDRIFMACDPAFGGGDFVAAPVCYQYDDDVYVVDVVYTNEDKKTSIPLVGNMIIRHNPQKTRIEANKSTEGYKKEIEDYLREKKARASIETKPAKENKSKEQRIFDKAPDIRERFIFLESGKRSREYELFMQNVLSFKFLGKNKHDDAPDSLAMAMDMVVSADNRIRVMQRFF